MVAEPASRSERLSVGNRAGWWSRCYGLKSVESVRELRSAFGASVGGGTLLSRLKGTSFPTPPDDRGCHESDASTVHDCAGRFDAQSRRQAANDLAALRQEVRGSPLRGTQVTRVGVDTRLLGKPSDFLGAQEAWGDWRTVFKGNAGGAHGRREGDRADPDLHDLG